MQLLSDVVEQILREYLHVAYQPAPKGPMVHCPYHDDNTPSAQIFVENTQVTFTCFACSNRRGIDFVDYVAHIRRASSQLVKQELERTYGYELDVVIDTDVIEKYHERIWYQDKAIEELAKRGVTEQLIKRYRIGFNAGRITIPVPNRFGMFVNIRRYKPGAPSRYKMRNQRNHGLKPRLFPIDQLQYDKILICGGELKAVVAADQLNPSGIGAVSSTCGEGHWFPEFNPEFTEKEKTWVCLDIDPAGESAATMIANTLCATAPWVGKVSLPMDTQNYPTGDINDFVVDCKGELLPLLEECPKWVPQYRNEELDTEIHEVSLNEAVHAEFTNKRVFLTATVTAVQQTPYTVPKTVAVSCDRSTQVCGLCPIATAEELPVREIPTEAAEILEMVDASSGKQQEAIKSALRIPKRCRIVEFQPLEFHHIEEARISPPMTLDNRHTDREMIPTMFVGEQAELNETYLINARMYPHPRNQQSTILASRFSPAEDTLSTYQCSNPEQLYRFRPAADTEDAINDKLKEIYADFEANVTQIYLRPDIHLTIDLAYHSLLNVYLRGKQQKGWVESLIIGDSAQGKTETATSLLNHYKLGISVDCKNATVAGLIGGLQQLDKRWFVTWGAIPTHDRRLVILEELKGLDVEVISKMTEMRSSGIAQIPKIENKRKAARTRLVALSNPRDNRRLEDRSKGVFAVRDLVGNLEDLRRFDIVHGVSARAIDAAQIQRFQLDQPEHEHIYTSELCHDLVLFAWTCTKMQIEDDRHLIQRSIDLTESLLCSEIPLIDGGSSQWKLLRLSTALAARLFSTNDDHTSVVVKPCHVDYVYNLFHRFYSDPCLDYARFVRTSSGEVLKNAEKVEVYVKQRPYARDFVQLAMDSNGFSHEDIMDWCGYDFESAKEVTSYLVRQGALRKRGKLYVNTPKFMNLLKKLAEEDDFPEPPKYQAKDDDF